MLTYAEHPSLLGSTNPCPIAVHMEPFSTSAFNGFIRPGASDVENEA